MILQRAYRALIEGCARLAALVLGATALAVSVDVLSRNLGLGAFPWILEGSEYSLPFATFLVAPWLLRRNQHVRLDVLLSMLRPAAARLLDRIANLIGLAICAVLVVYGARTILDSARQGSMVMKSLVFPEWWLFAPVPLCFALLAIEFVRRLGASSPTLGAGPQA